ncbi:unnamed protein product [Macrosiphum euphorbiae]|uniref:Uncharacterized protein n=1 Tax=Macrosiphum euphorbiae TaxID=13131 RepID=A0AAV0Y7A0_9HEMI|nr:unnamed protein product [Macrosiphum euphorbiae]
MEKDQGHEYRGKNLDEIDINVDTLVSDEENVSNDDDDDNKDHKSPTKTSSVDKTDNKQNIKDIKDTPPKKKMRRSKSITNESKNMKNVKPKFNRVPWTEDQKKVTTHFFQKHILLKKAPKKEECEEIKKK